MVNDNTSVRVRIAPSPTGAFHIGTARTALFNYLFARRHEGKFIVRIEDTDTERNDPAMVKDILDGLRWLGMEWDEGPQVGGALGPYFQSERTALYQKFIDQLLESGRAYKCFCTAEELAAERARQQAAKEPPKYAGTCRHLSAEQIAQHEKAGHPFAVRFKTPSQKVVIKDLIKGDLTFDANLFGDFVIQRAGGAPLFIFAVVVDDHLMAISHVFRGEEHLPNAAKHLLIAEALNVMPPQFGHFPLIINPDRSKMSKRKNPVSVSNDYRAKGYLPEAIINFIALLGWSPGGDRELFTMHELIQDFQIERVGASPSVFDQEKLLWMNGYYIRHLPVGDLASRSVEFIKDPAIKKASSERPEFYLQAVSLVQDRLKTLAELEEHIAFCFSLPSYDKALLVAKKSDEVRTKTALAAADAALKKMAVFTIDELDVALRSAARASELDDGELLWTVRVALTGAAASPGVFEVLEVLGKEESLKRIQVAIKKIS